MQRPLKLFVPPLAALFLAALLPAEEPGVIDTPQAHALTVTVPPHHPGSPREHAMNRVLIYCDAGRVTLSAPDGKIEEIEFKAGDIRWSPAGKPYIMENVTDHPIRIVEIELKGKEPDRPAPVTKLDPVVVDAQHYKVELENAQVRVMRVHYEPHAKGVLHEHLLNRVVWYGNDQGAYKAGALHVSGPGVHTEENASDQPADRIAVELK